MTYKIIDVSKYQGTIDWQQVKGAVDGVIIRVGYRGYASAGTIAVDSYADRNINECIRLGIPYGIYFFTQAKTYAEGVEEAKWCHDYLARFVTKPLLPVYIDTETSSGNGQGRADNLTNTQRTDACLGFLETLSRLNYYTGIYASTSWFNSKLEDARLVQYTHWVADYRGYCGYTKRHDMWQYTSSESISGIAGRCDCSECYIDFPSIVKAKGLNGWSAEQIAPQPQPTQAMRLCTGFASSGDLFTIGNKLQELCIEYETDEGFIYTEEMSAGDVSTITALCNALCVDCKEYVPIIITEQAAQTEQEQPAKNWLQMFFEWLWHLIFKE